MRIFAASANDSRRDDFALSMATHTLRKMCLGGIYDHLGGGFCRYSVDERWMIPHFEKMLYDNGPLLVLCAQAWQATGENLFRKVAAETGEWVMRDMQSPEGGYYSSLDADSEGEEGKFYVWEPEEVRGLLRDEDYPVFAARFGLDRPPNFEGRHWHLHVFTELEELARRFDSDGVADRGGSRARPRHPASGPVGACLAGARRQGADFVERAHGQGDGGGGRHPVGAALHSLRGARARVSSEKPSGGRVACAPPTRTGAPGSPRTSTTTPFSSTRFWPCSREEWNRDHLDFAIDLAEVLLAHFEDPASGGFFFTADDHEVLIHRSKPFADDALPAGNGIAAHALGRLGHLLGDSRYLDAAERGVRAGWSSLARIPHAHTAMLLAVEEFIHPPQTTVLRAEPEDLSVWKERCRRHYAPRRAVFAIPAGEAELPGLLTERRPAAGPVAYVCRGHHCEAPITDARSSGRGDERGRSRPRLTPQRRGGE